MIHWDQSRSHHNSKPVMDEAEFIWGIRVLFLGLRGIVGRWIEILGPIGDDNEVSFELRLARRFRISSVDSSLSRYLISLYIWDILCNIIHDSLGSIYLALLFLMLDTFTNTILLFLLCISRPYSLRIDSLDYWAGILVWWIGCDIFVWLSCVDYFNDKLQFRS